MTEFSLTTLVRIPSFTGITVVKEGYLGISKNYIMVENVRYSIPIVIHDSQVPKISGLYHASLEDFKKDRWNLKLEDFIGMFFRATINNTEMYSKSFMMFPGPEMHDAAMQIKGFSMGKGLNYIECNDEPSTDYRDVIILPRGIVHALYYDCEQWIDDNVEHVKMAGIHKEYHFVATARTDKARLGRTEGKRELK